MGFSAFDVTLTTTQQQTVPLQPINILQQPAPQNGVPSAVATNSAIASATVSADGTSVLVKGIAAGSTTILVTGTSVSGKQFAGSFTVFVTSPDVVAEAVGFEFDFTVPPVSQ
jgi:hypothetical protein